MNHRLTAAGLVVVLAASGCASSSGSESAGSTTVTPAVVTVEQTDSSAPTTVPSLDASDDEIAAAGAAVTTTLATGLAPDGSAPLDTALRAFSATIAELPGVDAGIEPTDAVVSGFAAGWIAPHLDELSTEQAAVVAAAFGVSPEHAAFASIRRAAPPQELDRVLSIVDDVRGFVNPKLDPPTSVDMEVQIVDPGSAQSAQAQLWSWWDGSSCRVDVRRGALDVYLPDELDLITDIASSVVRCELAAQVPQGVIAPSWLVDGASTWMACQYMAVVRQTSSPRCSAMWVSYLSTGSTSLFQRSDDALGFFGQLDSVMRESAPVPDYVWAAIIPALRVPSAQAYADLVAPAADRWPFRWASGQLQNRDLGSAWNITDITASGSATALVTVVGSDVSFEAAASPYSVGLWDIRGGDADVVTIAGTGFARVQLLGPESESDTELTTELTACLKAGGCSCPGESIRLPATDVVFLAVTGHDLGSSFEISGSSLEDYCTRNTTESAAATSRICAAFPGDEVGRVTGQALGEPTTPVGFDPNAIGGQTGCVWMDAPGWSVQIFPGSATTVPSAKDYAITCRFWNAIAAIGGPGWVACVGQTPEGFGYADIQTANTGMLLTTPAGVSVDALKDAVEVIGEAYR